MARRRYQYDEDLFKDTTMTFGEHLEELRMSLFKALVGLVVGFIFGLLVGQDVVDFLQAPLREALTKFYEKQSLEKATQKLAELRKSGYPLPDDEESLANLMASQGLVLEAVFVNPQELARQLGRSAAWAGIHLPPPSSPPADQPPAADQPRAAAQNPAAAQELVPIFLWRPAEDKVRITNLAPHESFTIFVKAAFVIGLVVSSPWVFYQLWSFVAAGLYPHEKRYVHVFLPFSVGLFLAGAALAFFFVFEPVLRFLFMFNRNMNIDPDMRISDWLNFVLVLPLGFGIAFQLPLVMLFLERIGIFDVAAYLSRWRLAVVVITFLSMMLTPPDPTSMILMGLPLSALYFGGILLCKLMPPISSPFDEDFEAGP